MNIYNVVAFIVSLYCISLHSSEPFSGYVSARTQGSMRLESPNRRQQSDPRPSAIATFDEENEHSYASVGLLSNERMLRTRRAVHALSPFHINVNDQEGLGRQRFLGSQSSEDVSRSHPLLIIQENAADSRMLTQDVATETAVVPVPINDKNLLPIQNDNYTAANTKLSIKTKICYLGLSLGIVLRTAWDLSEIFSSHDISTHENESLPERVWPLIWDGFSCLTVYLLYKFNEKALG